MLPAVVIVAALPAPPLRFLDLADNGLSDALVRRCLVAQRRRQPCLQWCDLSGNFEFDPAPPRLGVEAHRWAAHNRPPFQVNLSLPMFVAVLFAGLPVAWCIENDTSTDGKGDLVPPGALDMVHRSVAI